MRSNLAVLVAAAALLLAACSGDDASEDAPDDVTFDDHGISWPQVDREDPYAFTLPEVPERPASISAQDWDDAAETIRTWAVESAFVDHEDAAFEAVAARVFDALPEQTREDVVARVSSGTAPRLAAATVIDGEIDEVRATAAWNVSEYEDDGDVVRLVLQTRTAYEVQAGDRTEVVGVVRSVGLNLRPDATPGAWLVWEEFGADDCSLAADDSLVPANDLEAERDALDTFAELGGTDGFAAVDPDRVVDEEFRETCEKSAA